MMSIPPPSLQSRQRLHQRQQSTPVAFEAMKVQIPPNPARQSMHRRGQSFDISRSPIRRHQRTGSAVSTNTNLGQHILREAQQQKFARPGQQQIQPRVDTSIAQQYGGYPPTHSLPGTPYDMTMNAYMSVPQNMIQHSQYQNMQMHMQMPQSSPVLYSPMENTQGYFQTMHQMQESPVMPNFERRISQPDLRIQTSLRPYTPTHQIQTANFPLTPATTPMQHLQIQTSHSSPRWHQTDESILSPKPVSMTKSRSLQGIAEHHEMQSFSEDFEVPELAPKETTTFTKEPSKQKKPAHSTTNSISSVKLESVPLFGEVSHANSQQEQQSYPVLSSSQAPTSPTRPSLSPRRMSISDLKLEPGISASIEETNVSLDDIAQFIEGPMADDGKWICKYEDCNKRFGRKENIKSHVQTHLGDRQFRCDHCNKCFVRGHDLKRHAKIHTGTKAYTCLCGNAFARHDALTRHRQRGMCIGAFEGVIRKDVKRGRPRKHRPEMDERVDKASRSRRHHLDASSDQLMGANDLYTSSASSCSMSSWGSPPTEPMDNLSIHGAGPRSPHTQYDEALDLFGLTQQDIDHQNSIESMNRAAMPLDMFSSFTPPTSPGYSTGNRSSPSFRETTPSELIAIRYGQSMARPSEQSMNELDLLPPQQSSRHIHQILEEDIQSSQACLVPSSPQFMHMTAAPNMFSNDHLSTQHGTTAASAPSLPALSHSSSPPPQEPGSALVFDFSDDNNMLRMSTMSNISNMSFGLTSIAKAINSSSQAQNNNEEQQRNDFDSFLDYNDDSQMGVKFGLDDSDSFFAGI